MKLLLEREALRVGALRACPIAWSSIRKRAVWSHFGLEMSCLWLLPVQELMQQNCRYFCHITIKQVGFNNTSSVWTLSRYYNNSKEKKKIKQLNVPSAGMKHCTHTQKIIICCVCWILNFTLPGHGSRERGAAVMKPLGSTKIEIIAALSHCTSTWLTSVRKLKHHFTN